MAYPRECAGCGIRYRGFSEPGECAHVTLGAEDGGTPSPWASDKSGRIMALGCLACGAIFEWDYFGQAPGEQRLGQPLRVLRDPVAGWQSGGTFAVGRSRRPSVAIYSRAV